MLLWKTEGNVVFLKHVNFTNISLVSLLVLNLKSIQLSVSVSEFDGPPFTILHSVYSQNYN